MIFGRRKPPNRRRPPGCRRRKSRKSFPAGFSDRNQKWSSRLDLPDPHTQSPPLATTATPLSPPSPPLPPHTETTTSTHVTTSTPSSSSYHHHHFHRHTTRLSVSVVLSTATTTRVCWVLILADGCVGYGCRNSRGKAAKRGVWFGWQPPPGCRVGCGTADIAGLGIGLAAGQPCIAGLGVGLASGQPGTTGEGMLGLGQRV
ncbi:hypothetical protein Tco_1240808 [Tanacetum coccineum]